MSRASQTMRIEIPPDLMEEIRRPKTRGGGIIQLPSPEPDIPVMPKAPTHSSIGDTDFQELFQSVYDGAIIADLSGKIMEANLRAVGFLQYSRPELLALTLTHIISGATPAIITTLAAGVEKDRFILIQAFCTRKDSTLFPAEIAVNRLKVKGKLYLCCFIRDITWRRQAEEMLKTVSIAIQIAATGIAISDLDSQIDYINQAGALLLNTGKTEAIIGRRLTDLLPDRDAANAILDTVKAGKSWIGEIILGRHDSTIVHIQLAAAPNRNTDEQLVGMVFSFLDISDRIRAKDAEQQAERQRVMVESLGAACHHLGQPATVLLASLELLSRTNKSNDKALGEELLASSIEAAESLRTMLHNLNDITEYRTMPYIERHHTFDQSESRILDVAK